MSDEIKKKSGLEYFISEKGPIAVVIFIGELTKATLDVIEECQKDLEGRKTALHIIVFRDVLAVDLNAVAPLIRLQKLLRGKGALRVCSIKPELGRFLLEKAVIRDGECANNLNEALASLRPELEKIKNNG